MLPARDERVTAVHALLRLASHISIGPDGGGGILPSSAAVLEAPGSKAHPGAFSGLRLLRGEALEAAAPALRIWLAEKLLEDPPHEMRWLGVAGDDLKASLHLHCYCHSKMPALIPAESPRDGTLPAGTHPASHHRHVRPGRSSAGPRKRLAVGGPDQPSAGTARPAGVRHAPARLGGAPPGELRSVQVRRSALVEQGGPALSVSTADKPRLA